MNEIKPLYHEQYVGNISVLLPSPHHLKIFNDYINIKYANIKFTNEKRLTGN